MSPNDDPDKDPIQENDVVIGPNGEKWTVGNVVLPDNSPTKSTGDPGIRRMTLGQALRHGFETVLATVNSLIDDSRTANDLRRAQFNQIDNALKTIQNASDENTRTFAESCEAIRREVTEFASRHQSLQDSLPNWEKERHDAESRQREHAEQIVELGRVIESHGAQREVRLAAVIKSLEELQKQLAESAQRQTQSERTLVAITETHRAIESKQVDAEVAMSEMATMIREAVSRTLDAIRKTDESVAVNHSQVGNLVTNLFDTQRGQSEQIQKAIDETKRVIESKQKHTDNAMSEMASMIREAARRTLDGIQKTDESVELNHSQVGNLITDLITSLSDKHRSQHDQLQKGIDETQLVIESKQKQTDVAFAKLTDAINDTGKQTLDSIRQTNDSVDLKQSQVDNQISDLSDVLRGQTQQFQTAINESRNALDTRLIETGKRVSELHGTITDHRSVTDAIHDRVATSLEVMRSTNQQLDEQVQSLSEIPGHLNSLLKENLNEQKSTQKRLSRLRTAVWVGIVISICALGGAATCIALLWQRGAI